MLTHYDVLDVAYDADTDAILRAYEARRRELHLARDGAHGRERRRVDGELGRVESAYRTLCDPAKRDRYDELLAERSLEDESTPSVPAMTLKDFYDDPARAASAEIDFGSRWQREGAGPWKVVWLEATGELVAINETGLGRAGVGASGGGSSLADLAIGVVLDAAIDGLVNASHHKRTERAEVLVVAIQRDGDRLRRALNGWQNHMGDADGLQWLAERA